MCRNKIFLAFICITCFCEEYVESWTCGIFSFGASNNDKALTANDASETPKLSICCPPGSSMTNSKSTKCTSSTTKLKIPEIFQKNLTPSTRKPEDFKQLYRMPCTHGIYELSTPYHLLEDGRILVNKTDEQMTDTLMEIDDYCMTSWEGKNGVKTRIIACTPEDYQTLFTIILSLPIPFLIITFCVYACLPQLRNIHGMILMAYVASAFWMYTGVILARTKILKFAHFEYMCDTIGFCVYLSFLSSFFWLNVMCFDIWWTFRQIRSSTRNGGVENGIWKTFIIYSLYAWGCPAILVAICVILDFKPRYGEFHFWPREMTRESIYFCCPIIIIVFCNIFFFGSTTWNITLNKKATVKWLSGENSNRHNYHEQRYNLYLKLFMVMGLNWSVEIISWLVQHNPHWIWYLTDASNSFQGIMIFVIFVCKDRIKQHLLARFICHKTDPV